MKAKHSLIQIFVGALLYLLAYTFHIQHWPCSWQMYMLSVFLFGAGLLLLLIKILQYPKFKDFLDS